MWKSNGESKAKDGDKLTSKIQGLRLLSRIMSNPRMSKQFDLFVVLLIF